MYYFPTETRIDKIFCGVLVLISSCIFLPMIFSLVHSAKESSSLTFLFILMCMTLCAYLYIFSIGLFYYRTSSVGLQPNFILIYLNKKKKICIPASEIISIKYVSSRYTGRSYSGAPAKVYYRILFRVGSSVRKIYFADLIDKSPVIGFLETLCDFSSFSKKVDRSSEFMKYIGVATKS